LKKKYSIKENTSVQKVLGRVRFLTSKTCIVYILSNGTNKNNIAFLAGKKLGKAPVRNKAKRKLRAAIRVYWPFLYKGYDIVIIARPLLLTNGQDILLNDLDMLLKKHKILNVAERKKSHALVINKMGDTSNEKTV